MSPRGETEMSEALRDEELIAYADGELANGRRAIVEAAMEANPSLQERVEALRSMRRVARRAIRDDSPPVPDALRRQIAMLAAQPSAAELRMRMWWRGSMAVAAILAIGLCVFAIARWAQLTTSPRNVALASTGIPILDAHLNAPRSFDDSRNFGETDLRGPDSADEQSFLRARPQLAGAAMKRLDATVCLPDLYNINYRYAGGQMLTVRERPVLQLLYIGTSPTGGRLSVYYRKSERALMSLGDIEERRIGPEGGNLMAVWNRGDVLCHVIADRNEDVRPAMVAVSKRMTEIMEMGSP